MRLKDSGVVDQDVSVKRISWGDIVTRACFGTREFSATNGICKGCEDYEECKKIAPKRKPFDKVKKWGSHA